MAKKPSKAQRARATAKRKVVKARTPKGSRNVPPMPEDVLHSFAEKQMRQDAARQRRAKATKSTQRNARSKVKHG